MGFGVKCDSHAFFCWYLRNPGAANALQQEEGDMKIEKLVQCISLLVTLTVGSGCGLLNRQSE